MKIERFEAKLIEQARSVDAANEPSERREELRKLSVLEERLSDLNSSHYYEWCLHRYGSEYERNQKQPRIL